MNEKIQNVLLGVVIVFVISVLIFSLSSLFNGNTAGNAVNTAQFETKTSDSTVTVDLTPTGFENGKFYIDIGVNTHTVTLSDYNLKEIVTLEYDGKSLSPASAPVVSGHHNSGTLMFDTGKAIENFKVIVKDFPEISKRVFEWS